MHLGFIPGPSMYLRFWVLAFWVLFLGTFTFFWGRSFNFSTFGFLKGFDCMVCHFQTAQTSGRMHHHKIANVIAHASKTVTAIV